MKLTIFVLFAMTFALSEAIVCTNDCSDVPCPQIRCMEGYKPRKVGCDCCVKCVKILQEGETCFALHGVPQTSECDDNLICHNGKCIKLSKYVQEHTKY